MSSTAISDLRGLPRVIITLPNFAVIADRDPAAPDADYPGTMRIVNGYGSDYPAANLYEGTINVKIAGNSTAASPKKPLGISTTTATGSKNLVPLLGMGSHNKWRLLAMAYDQSAGREQHAYSLGRRLPLAWVSRTRMVELWYNMSGTEIYQGLYTMAETIKQGTDRVNVSGAGSFICESVIDYTVTLPDDLAVMFTMDGAGGSLASYLLDYKGTGGTLATAKTYIAGFETALAAALASGDFSVVWSQWVDFESTLAFFAMAEILKNFETAAKGWRLCRDTASGKYGGKLFFVPWDHDLSQGNSQNYSSPEGLQLNINWYFLRFYSDPVFYTALAAMIHKFAPLVYHNIEIRKANAEYLTATGAAARNYALWGGIFAPLDVQDSSFAQAVDRHVTWLMDRMTWLRSALPLQPYAPPPDTEAISIVRQSPAAPPNPAALLYWFDFSFNASVLNYFGAPAGFYEPVASIRNLADGSLATQADSALFGRYLPYAGRKYLQPSPVAGHYAAAAYHASMAITGEMTVVSCIAPLSWRPAFAKIIASRDPWTLYLLPSGQLQLSCVAAGPVQMIAASTVPVPNYGKLRELRVRAHRSAAGSVKFATSPDGIVWTQLGAAVATSAAPMIASTSPLELGSALLGVVVPTYKFQGRIHSVTLISGPPSGTVSLDWHAADSTHLDYQGTSRTNGIVVTYGYRCWLIGQSALVVDPALGQMAYNLPAAIAPPAAFTSALAIGSRAPGEQVYSAGSTADVGGYAGPSFVSASGDFVACNGAIYGTRDGATLTSINRQRLIATYPGSGTVMVMRQNASSANVTVAPLVSAAQLQTLFYIGGNIQQGGAFGKLALWNNVQVAADVDKWLTS